MINYRRVLKAIKNIEEFDNKKKNRIIRRAILTEIFSFYKFILSLPFLILLTIFAVVSHTIVLICKTLAKISMVLDKILDKIEEFPPLIQFLTKEEIKETLELIKKKN